MGFTIDFKNACLRVHPEKLKVVRRELGKLVTHQKMTCRRMAAILGTVRSFLYAIPTLRAFTDLMVRFVDLHLQVGWDQPQEIPQLLVDQVKQVKDLLQNWPGRPFLNSTPERHLHSDASNLGWAGVDMASGNLVQEFWRGDQDMHINAKELHAAISTVKSLAKSGEKVQISVDNAVTWAYLQKSGGRKPLFNAMMRPFLQWCMEHNVKLQPQLVKSCEMMADGPSRWALDKGDYTLDQSIFQQLLQIFAPKITPEVDMFASPGNAKLSKFVARWPHFQAWDCDALHMDLHHVHHCYATPRGP